MSRWAATALSVLGGAGLYFLGQEELVRFVGLAAGASALAAVWLMSERTVRLVTAVLIALLWVGALVLVLLLPGGSVATVVACLLGLAGAVVIAVRGTDWPGLSSRFARGVTTPGEQDVSARELWESLDRGDDPTRGADTGPQENPHG